MKPIKTKENSNQHPRICEPINAIAADGRLALEGRKVLNYPYARIAKNCKIVSELPLTQVGDPSMGGAVDREKNSAEHEARIDGRETLNPTDCNQSR